MIKTNNLYCPPEADVICLDSNQALCVLSGTGGVESFNEGDELPEFGW